LNKNKFLMVVVFYDGEFENFCNLSVSYLQE